MRKVAAMEIRNCVKRLFLEANCFLCKDIIDKLNEFKEIEVSENGKEIINVIIENATMASENSTAICQDTGMSVVFIEMGQGVQVVQGDISNAVNEGVRAAYEEGYFRKSVVNDPLERRNTGDNTPAIIHYDIVPGDEIFIQVMPKGFGSENMSAIKMLKPSDGVEGVADFVVEVVQKAGSNPCPPIIVGVGLGGTMEKAAFLSKKALLRPLNKQNPKEYYKNLEEALLRRVNNLGIGPQGLGGITTALAVNIEAFPTHIAGLPVAVNITCHASRHKEARI